MVRIEGVLESVQYIYLKDEQSGLSSNISERSYSFVVNAGLPEGRFETVYENDIVLGSRSAKRKEVLIYRTSNDFIFESASKIIPMLKSIDEEDKPKSN